MLLLMILIYNVFTLFTNYSPQRITASSLQSHVRVIYHQWRGYWLAMAT